MWNCLGELDNASPRYQSLVILGLGCAVGQRHYAEWRTEREKERGGRFRYALPTFGQYLGAVGEGTRALAFGNRFRPKWVKSCFARPRATPEPVLRFPIDESVYGVFDMAGRRVGRGYMELTGYER